ncbi:eukaryotic rRNA processing protein EBP2-domain-containing protein [Aspergillus carlsbadensis]|nr:eukaryotic rRNA processing protein EBP2-domain-containing protein [Aspergillus carlsbadensis]
MPKRSKLLQALDEHKGRDYDAEKQKKLVKAAKKRKGVSGEEEVLKSKKKEIEEEENDTSDSEAESIDDEEAAVEAPENEDDEVEEGDEEEEEDIPLSDLSEADMEDVVPHQRLTINNTAALSTSTKRISFITHLTPFSEHNSLVSAEDIDVPDANDDLNRELAFYKVAQSAALQARTLLKKEGVNFTRPGDYFAEMVKTDEHMGKIKKKLYDEAASKKAAAEARKQRDLKKFGKQVQVAKLQQRAKEKREALEKINALKKKRKGDTSASAGGEADDLFDVAVEDAVSDNPRKRARGADSGPNMKRQKKNEKYGFGGKKRFSKSGDAISSGDMRSYPGRKMKAGGGGGAKRPGKSKRAAARGRA